MHRVNSVMLIDDNRADNTINRYLLKKLEITGHILVSNSAIEALDFFRQIEGRDAAQAENAPGLILLDINMPGMDGFQFLDEFEKLKLREVQKVDIIILTSSADVLDYDRANKHPLCSGIVQKPLTKEKFLPYLEQLYGP